MIVSRINRRQLATASLALAAGLSGATRGLAQESTPVPERTSGWPLYGHDLLGDRTTTTSGISSATIDSLTALWQVDVGGPVSATPVISDGVAFIGSYDGTLYALDLVSGVTRWSYASGSPVQEPNLKIPLGITGSAAVGDNVVYVGDSAAVVHAIDRTTGEARWTKKIDDQPQASIWSSPVIAGNTVFVGVASVAKEVGFRGSVVALDAERGEIVWQRYMVPEGADGAGVFAVPAIDTTRGLLYVGTQNAYSPNPAPFGNPTSIVALDLERGDIAWVFNAPPGGTKAPTDDVAFSASPNLFSARIDGRQRDLIGEGQKSGDYWALDRDTGGVVWQAKVSPSGFLGGMEGSSAVADGIVAVPATNWPEFDGPAKGLVTGLDAATGKTVWTAEQTAPAASPVAIADDIVMHAGIDGVLHAYALRSGKELGLADLGASVSGGIAIADGVVVLAAATPAFAPFVKPGHTIYAFAVNGSSGTPEATPALP
ncbi:MAG: PQQ-binding-like beta-propeller repeat protein [Thermomicrobiales bacterium]